MRRMITGKLIEWIKSLKDKIHQNGNTTEIGGNVEVDGDLQVNSSILDSDGDEAIDIGTSDISIHKNVNVGSVDEPENLFVSGEFSVKSHKDLHTITITEEMYNEFIYAYEIPSSLIKLNTPTEIIIPNTLTHINEAFRIQSNNAKICVLCGSLSSVNFDEVINACELGYSASMSNYIDIFLNTDNYSIFITDYIILIGKHEEVL